MKRYKKKTKTKTQRVKQRREVKGPGKIFFPPTWSLPFFQHYRWYIITCIVSRKACLPSPLLGKGTRLQFYCNWDYLTINGHLTERPNYGKDLCQLSSLSNKPSLTLAMHIVKYNPWQQSRGHKNCFSTIWSIAKRVQPGKNHTNF